MLPHVNYANLETFDYIKYSGDRFSLIKGTGLKFSVNENPTVFLIRNEVRSKQLIVLLALVLFITARDYTRAMITYYSLSFGG